MLRGWLVLGGLATLLVCMVGIRAAEITVTSTDDAARKDSGLNFTSHDFTFDPEASKEKLFESYQTHFRIKRAEQVAVSERLMERQKYEYRYKVLKEVVDELFRVLWRSQKLLNGMDRTALEDIPVANTTILEAHLHVWENTAYFGELLLRHPDIVHQMIDAHELRKKVMKWSIEFCLASRLYQETDHHRKLLELMLQELRMADTLDPDYTNPFSETDQIRLARLRREEEDRAGLRKHKKQREREQRQKEKKKNMRSSTGKSRAGGKASVGADHAESTANAASTTNDTPRTLGRQHSSENSDPVRQTRSEPRRHRRRNAENGDDDDGDLTGSPGRARYTEL